MLKDVRQKFIQDLAREKKYILNFVIVNDYEVCCKFDKNITIFYITNLINNYLNYYPCSAADKKIIKTFTVDYTKKIIVIHFVEED